MANNQSQRPSFIPQKGSGESKPQDALNAYSIAAYIIFFATILVAGGLYGVNWWLHDHVSERAKAIGSVQDAMSDELYQELVALDRQVGKAITLTADRLAVSRLFPLIEEVTAANVAMKDFRYQGAPGEEATITMEAVTDSFHSLAFQTDVLKSEESRLESVEISDLNVNEDDYTVKIKAVVPFEEIAFFTEEDDEDNEEVTEE